MNLGRALQNWLDSHGLGAIVAAVIGVIVTLAVILESADIISSPRKHYPAPFGEIDSGHHRRHLQ